MAYRLQVVTTGYPGSPGYNNFYMLGSSGEISAWVDNVEALWTGLSSNLANGTVVSFDGFVEQFDTSTGQTEAIISASPFTQNGSWGTNKAPGGTALVLQWRSGVFVNGRELRGRSFISGLGDIGDSTGAPGSSNVTDAASAAATYAATDTAAIYSPTNADMVTMSAGACWNKFGLIRSRRD